MVVHVIVGGEVYNGSSFEKGVAVVYEGDKIIGLMKEEEALAQYSGSGNHVMDVGGKVVLPGMICAHGHFYGMYARGTAFPGPAPTNFVEILERIWWKLVCLGFVRK